MYDLYIIWIALVLLIAVGTFLSTSLYTRFGKGNHTRGTRLNTLDRMLYQQQRSVLLSSHAMWLNVYLPILTYTKQELPGSYFIIFACQAVLLLFVLLLRLVSCSCSDCGFFILTRLDILIAAAKLHGWDCRFRNERFCDRRLIHDKLLRSST